MHHDSTFKVALALVAIVMGLSLQGCAPTGCGGSSVTGPVARASCTAPTSAAIGASNRDKTGTTGVPEKNRGLQVAVNAALTGRVSRGSERGRFSGCWDVRVEWLGVSRLASSFVPPCGGE